ncbi:hypothetical protein EQG49_12300 [Periweissella cryptocerci]|uniref:Uncharacterized protein n=1 Tax=Periweissella cryptocerci TaxID=2506420 RepID=A0A4P6YWB4_9LACO|nr:hypothetical protein [Periweissella cryptocerci]QBO37179.1 hypothetical protein EQG49_12300 [Periweissella cryptocerci]
MKLVKVTAVVAAALFSASVIASPASAASKTVSSSNYTVNKGKRTYTTTKQLYIKAAKGTKVTVSTKGKTVKKATLKKATQTLKLAKKTTLKNGQKITVKLAKKGQKTVSFTVTAWSHSLTVKSRKNQSTVYNLQKGFKIATKKGAKVTIYLKNASGSWSQVKSFKATSSKLTTTKMTLKAGKTYKIASTYKKNTVSVTKIIKKSVAPKVSFKSTLKFNGKTATISGSVNDKNAAFKASAGKLAWSGKNFTVSGLTQAQASKVTVTAGKEKINLAAKKSYKLNPVSIKTVDMKGVNLTKYSDPTFANVVNVFTKFSGISKLDARNTTVTKTQLQVLLNEKQTNNGSAFVIVSTLQAHNGTLDLTGMKITGLTGHESYKNAKEVAAYAKNSLATHGVTTITVKG